MEKIKLIFSKFLKFLFLFLKINLLPFKYGLRGDSEEVLNLYKDSFEFIHEISKLITLLSSIASAFFIADIDKIKLMKIDSPFTFWFLTILYVCFIWRFFYRIYCLIVGSFVVNIHISEKL